MALVENNSMDTIKEIFTSSFWEKDNISLFHKEDNMIIIGNENKQFPIYFNSFDGIILPIIKEVKPTKINATINIQIASIQLQYFKNRIKFRNIFKLYIKNIKKSNIKKEPRILFLNHDTVTYKLSLDFTKLKNTKHTNSIFKNCDTLKSLVSKINTKDIIIKEIKNFNSNMSFPHYLEPQEDNIYKLNLHLFKNNTHKCIIKLDIDSNYYPLVPPKIQWVSPIISKDNYAALINSKIFSSSWNPVINISWLAQKLKQAFIERETDDDLIFSDKETSFTQDDILIMNFSKAIGRFTSTKPLDIQFNPIEVQNQTDKSHWKKGTGYGHTGLADWSLEDYLKKQSNIQSEIIKYLTDINDLDSISSNNSKYITELCFIEVSGITLMDIEKNTELYYKYFSLIYKFYSKEFNFDNIQSSVENISSLIESINISDTDNENIIQLKDLLSLIYQKIGFKPIIQENTNTDQEYCTTMKPLQFGYNDITTAKYQFSKHNGKSSSTKQMMRIAQEISSLTKSLPLNEESSVWIRWDKQQLTKMQFMISGPKDTPYQDGLFLFDCYFPTEYPKSPPKILLQTTGGGTVRFNPNLYNCGKVCLSLLGTWSGTAGEKWNEKTSTMLQVLVSIQSLIFIEQPFFNEPGFEKSIGSEKGTEQSEKYNQNIRQATSTWAIKDMIQNPPSGFEEIVFQHFNYKKDKIKIMLEDWYKKANKQTFKKNIKDSIKVIEDL